MSNPCDDFKKFLNEMYSEEQNAVDLLDEIFSIVVQSNEKVFGIKNNDENYDLLWDEVRGPIISEIEHTLEKHELRKN